MFKFHKKGIRIYGTDFQYLNACNAPHFFVLFGVINYLVELFGARVEAQYKIPAR